VRFLKSEINRLGWIQYDFDQDGVRINYRVLPEDSQLAKYATAFEYYGGSLEDLQLRSRGDWIFLTKGEFNLSEAEPYVGGQPSEGDYPTDNRHLDDTAPANRMASMKDWLIPKIKRQLEDLEFRIKRTIDLSDQHINEIVLLIKRSTGAETIQDLKTDIDFFLSTGDFPSAREG